MLILILNDKRLALITVFFPFNVDPAYYGKRTDKKTAALLWSYNTFSWKKQCNWIQAKKCEIFRESIFQRIES